MAGVYKGLTIKFGADVTGLSKALDQIGNKGKSLKREMRAINKALKLDPQNSELVRQKMAAYSKEAENARQRLQVLKQAESELGKEKLGSEGWDALQRDIARTDGELKKLEADWRSFTAQTAAANSGLGKAGHLLEDYGAKLSPLSRTATSAGRALSLGLTVPLVAASTASVVAATDIDSALTNVRKTVDGTEEQYRKLRDAAVEFSKTNAIEASEVLNIQSLGAQLGFEIDELEEFGRVVAGLDISTNLSADEAATQLAQFFNIMGTGHDQMSNFASALIDVGNNFATTEADVMAMSMNIAGAGKAIGLTEADVLGLATALTSVGIKAEMGGTAISTIMSQIDMDVAKGNQALSDWADVAGMSAQEFAAAWKSDPADAFRSFLAGLQQAASQEGNNISVMLDELGVSSIRQLDTMKRLAGAADLLPEAITTANVAYKDNVALSREVANFNESLASKFEQLKNRVTAIAAEIGEPLANALLDLLDMAQPLFEAIESGAKAFSSMSEGEQRIVVATLALIAAIGPALSIFGKVAGNVQALGKAMTATSKFIAELGVKSVVAKGGMEALGTTTDKQINRMGKLSLASSVAKGALVGLAIAGVAVLASAIADAVEKHRQLESATSGLESTISALDATIESASGSLDGHSKSTADVIKEQSELADSIKKSFEETATSTALVDRYRNKIIELAGNVGGSSTKLAELNQAIEAYNGLTGASISVTNSETGEISASTAELQRNTDAWIANAKAKALQRAAEDVIAQIVKDEMVLEEKRAEYEKYEKIYNNPKSDGTKKTDAWFAMQSLKGEINDLEGSIVSGNKTVDSYNERIGQLTDEATWATDAAAAFRKQLEAVGMSGDALDQAAERTGKSAADIASEIHGAAMGFETFQQIGVDAFSRLYAQAGMDVPAIVELVASLNAIGIDPKELTVTSDGSLQYQGQAIAELNDLQIDDKDYVVNDDGTIASSHEALKGIEYVRIGNKVYRVTDNGTGEEAKKTAEEVADAVDDIPSSHNTNITATDSTGSIFDTIKSKIASVASKIGINVSGNAAFDKRSGFVKLHGAGGFLTSGVTPLGRDRNGIMHVAGEAGQEWVMRHADGTTSILPTENRRYLEPYAKIISSMMPGGDVTTINNVNVSLAYDASADAKTITRDITRELRLRNLMRG